MSKIIKPILPKKIVCIIENINNITYGKTYNVFPFPFKMNDRQLEEFYSNDGMYYIQTDDGFISYMPKKYFNIVK